MDFALSERCVRGDDWDTLSDYLTERAVAIERADADILLCVSNTLHRIYDQITPSLNIPFLHIADPTGAAIRAQSLTKVALLGTRSTIQSSHIKQRLFDGYGIETMVPNDQSMAEIDRIIFDELCAGIMSETARSFFLAQVDLLTEHGAQGVILGCTEIPLLISQARTVRTSRCSTQPPYTATQPWSLLAFLKVKMSIWHEPRRSFGWERCIAPVYVRV